MILFKDYLKEAYGPIASLLQDEGNRQKLMRMGVSKNSKLVKIHMRDAVDNEEDLILFTNILPSGEEKLGKVKLITGIKKTKAREALAKKTDVPSIWIGYKKGEDFEVWRPIEAGENTKKKACKTLECLYDSDFAYKVVNPKKEELQRKFRQETPGRKEWVSGERETGLVGNLPYKMYRSKLIRLLDRVIDNVNKNTIKTFENRYEKPYQKNGIVDTSFDKWSESPIDNEGYVGSILSTLIQINKNKDNINKKNIENLISKIEKEVK